MQGQVIRRVGGLACAGALALCGAAAAQDVLPVPVPDAVVGDRAVDRTHRGTRVEVIVRGDDMLLNAAVAEGALGWRMRAARPLRITAACSDDVAGLDLAQLRPGRDIGGTQLVTPNPTTATVLLTIPGLGARMLAGADGCRARVSEPAGYRIAEVVVGFDPEIRRELYKQSLRTADRNRQALGAAEATITSALTHWVTHKNDLRGWKPTEDGRVPGESALQLRLVPSIRAVALRPAFEDVAYVLDPPGRPPSRDKLTVVVPSTAVDGRLVVIGRDLRTGRLRYQVLERAGLRVRYDSEDPPYAPCSDPVRTSRCTDNDVETPSAVKKLTKKKPPPKRRS